MNKKSNKIIFDIKCYFVAKCQFLIHLQLGYFCNLKNVKEGMCNYWYLWRLNFLFSAIKLHRSEYPLKKLMKLYNFGLKKIKMEENYVYDEVKGFK